MKSRWRGSAFFRSLPVAVWFAAGGMGSTAYAAEISEPQWIWHSGSEASSTAWVRKVFQTPALNWRAVLTVAGGEPAMVYLNGKEVAKTEAWNRPVRIEVSVQLIQGTNVLAIHAIRGNGPRGIAVALDMTGAQGSKRVVSDSTWVGSSNRSDDWAELGFDDRQWQAVAVLGKADDSPWGDVLRRPAATPAEAVQVPRGFEVDLVRSSGPDEGSWICMTFDHQGRVIVSPQGNRQPLLRFTLDGAGKVTQVEPVALSIRYAMGLLYAHDSLYANGHGPEGTGLYRLIDRNQNDQFEADEVVLLKRFKGEGEHGYHAVVLGPDDQIYVMNGNSTAPPAGLADAPYRHYGGDRLVFSDEEENPLLGAPAGYILKTDPEGKEWELLMGGFRNAYDFDFNTDGEIFTFDSDMEWDWGSSWYRPTRILHGVPGGEYGWRSETDLWPEEYPDSLPAAVNVGIGSPTGVKFGTRSRFPERYRRALFALDWSYGRILAIHLRPNGASYTGEVEPFLSGQPLNVVDIEFGADGAMYFITGGRGTQSGLYRVSYTGGDVGRSDRQEQHAESKSGAVTKSLESRSHRDVVSRSAAGARELRRELETLAANRDPGAVAAAWPHLDSADGWIRYAARLAIESRPWQEWSARALGEVRPTAGLTALLALARMGPRETQRDLLNALGRFRFESLDREQRILKLRVMELSCVRQGRPDPQLTRVFLEQIEPHFPTGEWLVDRELCRLLAYLNAPGMTGKLLELIRTTAIQEQQVHYISVLRHIRRGWSPEQRREYFGWWQKTRHELKHPPELLQWFRDVGREYTDGAHLHVILERFRQEALQGLSEREQAELGDLLALESAQRTDEGTGVETVRHWTTEDLIGDLGALSTERNREQGRQAFIKAQCLSCHRMGNEGGASGPELTGAGRKYSARDLLESILQPSKVVSDQYANTTFVLKENDEVTGRVISEDVERVVILVDAVRGTRRTIRTSEIQNRYVSQLSPMPEGLVDVLSKEEILDLVYYIQNFLPENP